MTGLVVGVLEGAVEELEGDGVFAVGVSSVHPLSPMVAVDNDGRHPRN
ncbi:hypothetical protein [Glaciihabitans sp. UYNi722]